ncbi:hypothetical protein [Arsenophonus endosymbiont of Aleurodicus floccissimus]|nr:hypothetical protein [Arsenophonus endosymbiont of Aleurodicus floccissimus]
MSFWSDFADGFTSVYTTYLPGLFTGIPISQITRLEKPERMK